MASLYVTVVTRAWDLVDAQVRHTESGGSGGDDAWSLVQVEAARDLDDREMFIGALSSVGAVLAHLASEERGKPIGELLAAGRLMMIGPRTG